MTNEKAREALTQVGVVQTTKAVPLGCPRCGDAYMREPIHTNAYSRHAECYICPDCGIDEALRDYTGDPLPPSKWSIITDVLDVLNGEAGAE